MIVSSLLEVDAM